jgi:ESCRT-II complex subunit VPS36
MREQENIIEKKELKNSFSNIETLKQNAEKMMKLAEKLRAKLDVSKGEDKEINNILKNIGYINPETKEIAGSEFYDKLANQINSYFNDYFNKNKSTKVISLIDAYCIYNRARGIELISPKDMKQAVNKLKYLPNQNIYLQSLNNEILVLHSVDYTSDNIIKSLKQFLSDNNKDFLTVNDIKKILNIENMILFKYLIDDLLINGKLCSDESDIEVNYYMNIISPYQFNYNY